MVQRPVFRLARRDPVHSGNRSCLGSRRDCPPYSANPDVCEKYKVPSTAEYFSPRILNVIVERFADYYRTYYPEVIGETRVGGRPDAVPNIPTGGDYAGEVQIGPDSYGVPNVPSVIPADGGSSDLADSIAASVKEETANDPPPAQEL